MRTTTRTGKNVSRSRAARGRVSEPLRSAGPAARAGRTQIRAQARARSAEAGAPAGACAGPPRSGPPVTASDARVTRLQPQPAPAYPGEHLPIAVGFGSIFEVAPRTLWVVPGTSAGAVALPELLDERSDLLDEGRAPLRLSPPVTTPTVGRQRGDLRRPARPSADRLPGDGRRRQREDVEAQPVALRLTARGRIALLVLAGLIGAAVVVFAWFGAGAGSAGPTTAAPARVVVHEGDTLWSIAGRVAPGRDPRAVVDQLRRLNKLGSPNLVPGEVLRTH